MQIELAKLGTRVEDPSLTSLAKQWDNFVEKEKMTTAKLWTPLNVAICISPVYLFLHNVYKKSIGRAALTQVG